MNCVTGNSTKPAIGPARYRLQAGAASQSSFVLYGNLQVERYCTDKTGLNGVPHCSTLTVYGLTLKWALYSPSPHGSRGIKPSSFASSRSRSSSPRDSRKSLTHQ